MMAVAYIKVSLEWVDFFSFQIYDRVVNCPLQYINGRGFSNYNISLGHISTNQNSCFIAKAMFYEFCVVMSVKISVHLYLKLFVGGTMFFSIYVICVCFRIVVSNAYCVVFLFCFSMLPVSLDCPFMIAPSEYSNVYFQ